MPDPPTDADSRQPMVAIQNSVSRADLAAAMAILTCSQTFAGAVSASVSQVIFAQGLRTNIPRYAPTVDVDSVVKTGATGFQSVVPPSDLPAVVAAYCKSINWVFYFVAGLSVLQFAFSWGVGWKSVRSKKEDMGGNSGKA